MMVMLKASRVKCAPYPFDDNFVDMAGYAGPCGGFAGGCVLRQSFRCRRRFDRRTRDDKWNDVLKAEHEIMNTLMQVFDRGVKFDAPFPPDRVSTARIERLMYRVRSIALKDAGND